MEQKKTVLIFGLSSFLGSNIAENLKDKYKVVGTYFNTPVNIPGVLSIKCDVHSKETVQKVVYLFKPDITIYTIGLTDLNGCQEFPKVADALNTAGVFNVSMASERYKSKFIYFSSSFIFSGEDITYKENDSPTPTSVYGNTIASSEFYIQKSCLNYIIFRCCPIFGRSNNTNDLKWVEAIERNEFLGQKISCDNKVYTGFIDVYTLCDILDKAIKSNITNKLLQLTSKNIMNRYEFAHHYIEEFGGNTGLLSKGDWHFPRTENQMAQHNLSDELKFKMDTYNLEKELSMTVPTIEESIKHYKQKLEGSVGAKKMTGAGITFI